MAPVGGKLNRPAVSHNQILDGLSHIQSSLERRLKEKGNGSYASRHEILGILIEEMDELIEAVRLDGKKGFIQFKKELMDIVVGAAFGFICLENKHIKPRK